jgi:hypothetical protein
MEIAKRVNIKHYENVQVDLLVDAYGNKYVEKTQYHHTPALPIPFHYGNNGLEIIRSIIEPLQIEHPRIIEGTNNEKCVSFIMEYMDGINCADEPKAEHVYKAAEKAGMLYAKSKKGLAAVDADVANKYSLTKEKILSYIQVIEQQTSIPSLDRLIERIFDSCKNRIPFVNHGDMQFKNFIYDGDIHLIDWDGVKIHPFFSDLYSLLEQARQIDADTEEVISRYKTSAQINAISDADIIMGGIIGSIVSLFDLIIYDCPTQWIDGTRNDLNQLAYSFCHDGFLKE